MKLDYGARGELNLRQTTAFLKEGIAADLGIPPERVEIEWIGSTKVEYFVHEDPPRTLETDDDAWEGNDENPDI